MWLQIEIQCMEKSHDSYLSSTFLHVKVLQDWSIEMVKEKIYDKLVCDEEGLKSIFLKSMILKLNDIYLQDGKLVKDYVKDYQLSSHIIALSLRRSNCVEFWNKD